VWRCLEGSNSKEIFVMRLVAIVVFHCVPKRLGWRCCGGNMYVVRCHGQVIWLSVLAFCIPNLIRLSGE
jgi:hypothetical protein